MKKKKILIIEDEESLADIYSEILTDVGYAIKTISSIKDAKKIAKTFAPDLLLIDHGLGNEHEENGVEGLPKLKKLFPKAIHIVFSNYLWCDVERMAAQGKYKKNLKMMDGFWHKLDVFSEELIKRVAEVLK